MTLPYRPAEQSPTAVSSGLELSEKERREAVIRAALLALTTNIPEYNKFRDYYEGEQALVIGKEALEAIFGPTAFANLRDNWCKTVVDAVADRLEIEGFILEGEQEESTLTDSLWKIFRDNDFDEQQEELHEAVLVEGLGSVIVWPDDVIKARLDWQPAQNVYVRYSDDDWRVPVLAIKRWITADSEVRVTIYTKEAVFKYHEQKVPTSVAPSPFARIIPTTPGHAFQPLAIPGEDWPLSNPLGVIPVVEFPARRGSELSDIIPLQDAINYLFITALSSAPFTAYPQWVFNTSAESPEGGWANTPGRVWKLPNVLDAEGKALPFSMGQFTPGSLSGFRELIEMTLQHAALISKTPVRMFFQSDRGGRGDAPSGESLIVDDEPLLDKVERHQARLGNSWIRVAKLVAKAAKLNDDFRGEVLWKDPRAKYRSSLLDEAKKMFDIGIPIRFIIRKLALTPDEVDLLEKMIDAEEVKKKAEEEQAFAREQEVAAASRPPPSTTTPPA